MQQEGHGMKRTMIVTLAALTAAALAGCAKPAGPKTTDIYHELRGIQLGEKPDTYGWIYEIHGS